MMQMCRDFAAELPERMAELRSTFQRSDAGALGRLGHNLKGVALNFSAEHLSSAAARLEESGRREDLSEVPAILDDLEDAVKSLQDYLAQRNGKSKEQA